MDKRKSSKKRRKKKRRRRQRLTGAGIAIRVVIALLLVAAIGVAGVYFWLRPYQNYPYILPNVYYAGENLGGLTENQALQAITRMQEDTGYRVQIIFPDDRSFYVTPERDFSAVDIDALVQEAMSYGRSEDETPMRVYRAVQLAEDTRYDLRSAVGFSYDQSNVLHQVESIVTQIELPPEDATGEGDSEAKTVTVIPGKAGRTADTEAIYQAVCEVIESGGNAEVRAEYKSSGVEEKQLEVLVDKLFDSYTSDPVDTELALDSVNHVVTITKGTPGYTFDKTALMDQVLSNVDNDVFDPVTIIMDEVLPSDPNLEILSSTVTSQPTPVEYHDGGLTGGDPGYTMDVDEAYSLLAQLDWGQSGQIQLTEILPDQTIEEMQSLLFRDELGRSDTYYVYDVNRTRNLELACAELDGIVLNDGATFSFNTFVGERTAERGFRTGVVYVDGTSDVETGGGICQVASTVYNAALRAGLEITDRMNHQFVVTYVAAGLDATVYWGVQDLCFKNNTGYPIRINASISGGQVHVSIDGTNLTGQYITLDSRQVSYDSKTITYEAFQYIHNANGSIAETVSLGQSVYDRGHG